MPTKILNYCSHHAIAILALTCSLLALAGASYAAMSLPKNSIGTRQIKNGAITPAKLNHSAIGGSVRMWARINAAGQLTASQPHARLVGWNVSPTASFGGGLIEWKQRVPAQCFALATVDRFPGPGYASTQTVTTPGTGFGSQVRVALSGPEGVDVAVIC